MFRSLSRTFGTKIFSTHFLPTQSQLKNIIRRHSSNDNFIKTNTGEWYIEEKNNFKVGLTKDSIEQLSEVVYAEALVEEGDSVSKEDEVISIESVKATESILSPFDGTVLEINSDLFDDLEELNKAPEDTENSWLIKIKK